MWCGIHPPKRRTERVAGSQIVICVLRIKALPYLERYPGLFEMTLPQNHPAQNLSIRPVIRPWQKVRGAWPEWVDCFPNEVRRQPSQEAGSASRAWMDWVGENRS